MRPSRAAPRRSNRPPAPALARPGTASWMPRPSENGQAPPAEGPSFAEPKKGREPRPVKINWFIPLVFIPLLLYAVLATVAVAFLYLRMASAPPTMFDQMPDMQGDTPGTQPAKAQGKIFNIDQKMATRPLPEHLKVALGSTVVVGDLEVTPTKLERGPLPHLLRRLRAAGADHVRGAETPPAAEEPREGLLLHPDGQLLRPQMVARRRGDPVDAPPGGIDDVLRRPRQVVPAAPRQE